LIVLKLFLQPKIFLELIFMIFWMVNGLHL